MRTCLQSGFLVLTLLGVFVVAGNAESWCPFGGIEALYTYFSEGSLPCSLAVSNFHILAAVLIMTLLLRRAFCGYMCPVGTLSDWLHRVSARLGVRRLAVPRGLDRTLSLAKYAVLAVVLFFTYRTGELVFRGFDPCYALISRHGEDITLWAYAVSGVIVLLSVFLTMPFCRWLCPLAAVLNPFSRVGVARIKRNETACIQCGECALACPMAIPVDEVAEVREARCISCLSCLGVCPAHAEATLVWGPTAWLGHRWPRTVLFAIVLGVTTAAVGASYLFEIPSFVATRGEQTGDLSTIELRIDGLTCRGRATLLMYFLERDDGFGLPGFLELKAWPGPQGARAMITFDAPLRQAEDVLRAVTEPYYDDVAGVWRFSPFSIQGFDPLADDASDEP